MSTDQDDRPTATPPSHSYDLRWQPGVRGVEHAAESWRNMTHRGTPTQNHMDDAHMTLLTAADCATRAGVRPSTFRAYVNRSQAPRPVARLGRKMLWDAEMVEEWLVGRRKR